MNLIWKLRKTSFAQKSKELIKLLKNENNFYREIKEKIKKERRVSLNDPIFNFIGISDTVYLLQNKIYQKGLALREKRYYLFIKKGGEISFITLDYLPFGEKRGKIKENIDIKVLLDWLLNDTTLQKIRKY